MRGEKKKRKNRKSLSSWLSCSISVQLIREFCECWCYSFLYYILTPYIYALRRVVSILFIFALAFPDDTAVNVKRCENEEQADEGYFWALLKILSLPHISVRKAAAESVHWKRCRLTCKCHHFRLVWCQELSAEFRMSNEKWCFCRLNWTSKSQGKRIRLQSIDWPVPSPAEIRCHQNRNLAWSVPI